jgi:fibronectin-binding autotransporter adhesin
MTAFAMLAFSSPLAAATYTWTNAGGAPGNWSNATNWNTTPTFNNTADVIFDRSISSAGYGEVTFLGAALTVRSITFGPNLQTPTGNTTFDVRTFSSSGSGAVNLTLSADSGNATITVSNNTTPLPLIRLGNSGGGNIVLATNTDVFQHDTNMNFIFDTVVSGAGALNKYGVGTLTLQRAGSFTGGVNINEGTVNWFNDATAVGTGTVTIGGAGSSTNATLLLSSALTYTNNIALNSGSGARNIEVASAIAATSSGLISGSGTLTKTGVGALTLNTSNSFTGGVRINAGTLSWGANQNALGTGNVTLGETGSSTSATLSLVNAFYTKDIIVSSGAGARTISGAGGANSVLTANIDLSAGKDVTFSPVTGLFHNGGTISGTGGIVKTGAGILGLSASNSFTGGVKINEGTVRWDAPNAIATNNTITLGQTASANNATLDIFANAYFTISNIIVSSGAGARTISGAGGANPVLTANIDLSAGQDVTFSPVTGLFQNGTISGTGGLVKTGVGQLTLNVSNSFTGNTTVSTGTFRLGNVDAIRNSTLNTGTSGSQTVAFAVAGINTYNLGGLAGADELAIGANTISVGANNANNTFTGNVTGTTGGFIKVGTGTQTLTASNTYSGATTVNGGTLQVASGGSISSATTVNNGATLNVSGTAGNVQVNSGGLLKGSGSVGAFTLASGGTLTPGNSPGTLTAASAIVLGGSTYNWEISALSGTAGTKWDLLSVGGLLDMSGVTSANKWNLVITGDSGFTGWTDTSSYTYVFAQAASVSGFSSTAGTDVTSLFNITTSGITSVPNASFNPSGDFKVVVGSANGGAVTTLNLMAVPEPSTGGLLLVGLGLVGAWRRRFSVR